MWEDVNLRSWLYHDMQRKNFTSFKCEDWPPAWSMWKWNVGGWKREPVDQTCQTGFHKLWKFKEPNFYYDTLCI